MPVLFVEVWLMMQATTDKRGKVNVVGLVPRGRPADTVDSDVSRRW